MRYKSGSHGIDQVGRELRVDYVLEGTVRRSEGRIRISSRLIKVGDQAQVWTDTGTRETEMFRVEEDSAAHIAGAVSGKLLGGAAICGGVACSQSGSLPGLFKWTLSGT